MMFMGHMVKQPVLPIILLSLESNTYVNRLCVWKDMQPNFITCNAFKVNVLATMFWHYYFHYYKSWLFKRFKLTNLSFWLMDMYILTKG
jgi:hypothetical protein